MGPKPKPTGDKSGKAEKKPEKKNEKKPATAPAAAGSSSGAAAAAAPKAAAPKAAKAAPAAAAKPAAAKSAAKPAASRPATAGAKVSAKPAAAKAAPAAKGAGKGAATAAKGAAAKKATGKAGAGGKSALKAAVKGTGKPQSGKKPVGKTIKKVDKPKRDVAPKSQKGGKVVKVQSPVKKALKIKMKDAGDPTAKYVHNMIAKHFVVIFSKTQCPYCKIAKDIFRRLKEKFTSIELDRREDGEDIQKLLGRLTGAKTVPRVFIDGKCIGGGSDVERLYQNGKLEDLLYDTDEE